MKKTIAITILLLDTLSVFATSYNALWQKGNSFYTQKQFDSAAYYYNQIAVLQPQNSVVYYNLGNAYYRLNNIGMAVLNYERALHADPNYKQAKDNLAFTESRISNRIQTLPYIFFVNWWHELTLGTQSLTWAIISLIIFLTIIVILLSNRLRGERKLFPPQLTGILVVVWLIFLSLSYAAAKNSINKNIAVVMQNDAPFTIEGQKNKAQVLIPEGTVVEIEGWQPPQAKIRLPDGRNGWMQLYLLNKI